MVSFLRHYQGGMGGGHLPETLMDQPVVMMAALSLMDSFEAKLTAKDADPLDEFGNVDYAEKERLAMASWGVG